MTTETLSESEDDTRVGRRHRRRTALLIAVPIGVVTLLLVGVLATRESAQNRLTRSPLVDQVAPPVQGQTLDGDDFELDQLQGRWVVFNFFATWCAPCRQEHPELVEFSARHDRAGDVVVVSIVYGDDTDVVRSFFEENGGDWPVVVGDEGRTSLDYGVAGVPESYLIDPGGFVRAKITGGVTADGLDGIVRNLQQAGF